MPVFPPFFRGFPTRISSAPRRCSVNWQKCSISKQSCRKLNPTTRWSPWHRTNLHALSHDSAHAACLPTPEIKQRLDLEKSGSIQTPLDLRPWGQCEHSSGMTADAIGSTDRFGQKCRFLRLRDSGGHPTRLAQASSMDASHLREASRCSPGKLCIPERHGSRLLNFP